MAFNLRVMASTLLLAMAFNLRVMASTLLLAMAFNLRVMASTLLLAMVSSLPRKYVDYLQIIFGSGVVETPHVSPVFLCAALVW